MNHSRLTLCMLLIASAPLLAFGESPKLAPRTKATALATICAIERARPATDVMTALKADPTLSSFVAALEKAQLTSLFSERKFYTIFAPTNAACAAMGATWDSLMQAADSAPLANLIKNHIVRYRYPAKELVKHPYLKTVAGNKVTVTKDETGIRLNESIRLTSTDIKVRCGVIHVIDAVIALPTEPQAPIEDLPAVVEPLAPVEPA